MHEIPNKKKMLFQNIVVDLKKTTDTDIFTEKLSNFQKMLVKENDQTRPNFNILDYVFDEIRNPSSLSPSSAFLSSSGINSPPSTTSVSSAATPPPTPPPLSSTISESLSGIIPPQLEYGIQETSASILPSFTQNIYHVSLNTIPQTLRIDEDTVRICPFDEFMCFIIFVTTS